MPITDIADNAQKDNDARESEAIQAQLPGADLSPSNGAVAHGGGGRVMRKLIEGSLLPLFEGQALPKIGLRPTTAPCLDMGDVRVAFTTDTFVVSPLFFPGGDIGKLAVYGTVNDLAMAGAVPMYLSCGLILEEGLSLEVLERVVDSMQQAAEEVGVKIVTGDTKVVDRGKGDGIFINTAGVGIDSRRCRYLACSGHRRR